MTSCVFSPTVTLYGLQTVFGIAETEMVTEVVPVAPSIATHFVTSRVCMTRPAGGEGCWATTSTVRNPIPGSSATRTRVVTKGTGRAITASTPTATLYRSSCFPTRRPATRTGLVPLSSSSVKIDTASKTLAGPDNGPSLDGSGLHKGANIGAIVGGLLGGFFTPILLVILVRYLLKLRRRRRSLGSGSPADMRSLSNSLPVAFTRPSSSPPSPQASRLHRVATFSDPGHQQVTFASSDSAYYLDRRPSRASRASAPTSYDGHGRRGAVSPASSSHGHEITRRSSTSHHGHHPPVAYERPRAVSPAVSVRGHVHADEQSSTHVPEVRGGSPVGARGPPYEPRRAASYGSFKDHPYALARAVPMGWGVPERDRSRAASPQQELASAPQSDGYVVGAPLASVDEHESLHVPAADSSEDPRPPGVRNSDVPDEDYERIVYEHRLGLGPTSGPFS